MTTEDYLAAIEASKSPLVKSLTYKRTDFEEVDPELFPELPSLPIFTKRPLSVFLGFFQSNYEF